LSTDLRRHLASPHRKCEKPQNDLTPRTHSSILIFVPAYDKVLATLADPTRRKLVERLRRRPHAVGELVRHLGISQPAVSQHLAVLRGAKVVQSRRDGRRRIYALDPGGLATLRAYLDGMWTDALAAFADSFAKEKV
jgi:DNA-binding transcriptional ArsR family regulator